MKTSEVIPWLLSGDVSIQYQVYRDLLGVNKKHLRSQISTVGWGARFLQKKNKAGCWGRGFYQPKWISTHYTLLDLKHLNISPNCKEIRSAISTILNDLKGDDGGIFPIGAKRASDVCVNGMFLNYASYFQANEEALMSLVDFLLAERMADGGFNCFSNTAEPSHSSVHTTISVLEGILEYSKNNYKYRLEELQKAGEQSREFLLQHKLFRSDKTGKIMSEKMLMLSFPSRWKYDILRALDYFRAAGVAYDSRMDEAIAVLFKKQRSDGTWPLQAKHPGQTHFEMEKPGKPSRWNTLRTLRVLKHFRALP